MSTTTRLITADEPLVMPRRDGHGNYCILESIRGEVKRMSPTGITHGILTSPTGVRVLGENDTLEGGDVLTGFTLELSKLFAVGKKRVAASFD